MCCVPVRWAGFLVMGEVVGGNCSPDRAEPPSFPVMRGLRRLVGGEQVVLTQRATSVLPGEQAGVVVVDVEHRSRLIEHGQHDALETRIVGQSNIFDRLVDVVKTYGCHARESMRSNSAEVGQPQIVGPVSHRDVICRPLVSAHRSEQGWIELEWKAEVREDDFRGDSIPVHLFEAPPRIEVAVEVTRLDDGTYPLVDDVRICAIEEMGRIDVPRSVLTEHLAERVKLLMI